MDENRFLKTMHRQDVHEQDELDEKGQKEVIMKKKKAYEMRKKIFLQKVMNGEIDVSQLTRKKNRKKDKKKKKRGFSDYIRSGKIRSKNGKVPQPPSKKFGEDGHRLQGRKQEA